MDSDRVYMKFADLWVPAGDMQLIDGLNVDVKKTKRPMVDGRVAWRYDRLAAALEFIPEDRRRTGLDIGAHIGLWTRWMAKHFEITHAFEPISEFMHCLQQNLILDYGDVKTHPVVLSDYHGKAHMVRETAISGRSHVQIDGTEEPTHFGQAWMLDEFEFRDVDFIKIDVEGYERRVLEGAQTTILRNRPVIVIEQLGHEIRYGDKRDAALALLKDWGMVELRPNMKGDFYMGWKNGSE